VIGRYLYFVPEIHPGVEVVAILADGSEPLCEWATKYIPDYPHDIAAAWRLVERMVAAGHDVAIHSYQSAEDHVSPFSTWCTVDESDDLDSGGTIAPRGICRAFVLAMSGGAR
jgi:hypothetical protein